VLDEIVLQRSKEIAAAHGTRRRCI
jgi:hypothetical protein